MQAQQHRQAFSSTWLLLFAFRSVALCRRGCSLLSLVACCRGCRRLASLGVSSYRRLFLCRLLLAVDQLHVASWLKSKERCERRERLLASGGATLSRGVAIRSTGVHILVTTWSPHPGYFVCWSPHPGYLVCWSPHPGYLCSTLNDIVNDWSPPPGYLSK
jgi:hypothetical protein